VGCHWCDVRKLNAELHPPSSINQIVSMQKYSETVVVTGDIDVGYDAIDPDA
jgi:hypothetical protein